MDTERSCGFCSRRFTPPAGNVRKGYGLFCSRACAKRKAPEAIKARYHYVNRPEHPLAGIDGRVAEHRVILYEKIGPGWHPCHWCGQKVRWLKTGGKTSHTALAVDHINQNSLDNHTGNLVPSCHACNANRGRTDLVGDNELFIMMQDTRHRAVQRACETCGQNFLHVAADRRPNRGRFCSRSCARSKPRSHRKTTNQSKSAGSVTV